MIFQKNNSFNAAFLYGILNICTFFGFDKSQSIETFERFTLQTQLNKKQIKLRYALNTFKHIYLLT